MSFLDSNFSGDVIRFIVLYVISLWFLVCLWVLIDANRRYKGFIFPVVMFLVVIIFNLLGLVFYLMVRPEKEEDHILVLNGREADNLYNLVQQNVSLVNIPVVSLKGENREAIDLILAIKIKRAGNHRSGFFVDEDIGDKIKFNIDLEEVTANCEVEKVNNKVDGSTFIERESTNLGAKEKRLQQNVIKSVFNKFLGLVSKALTSLKARVTHSIKVIDSNLHDGHPNEEDKVAPNYSEGNGGGENNVLVNNNDEKKHIVKVKSKREGG